MEKFYIVTEESNLRKEYLDYKKNFFEIQEHVKLFFKENNIESTSYIANNDRLSIVPTDNDNIIFLKSFTKIDYSDDTKMFRKNSKINKLWVKSLEDKQLKVLYRPDIWFYFCSYGRSRNRLFEIDEVVYCSYESTNEFETPKGFKEIKASEFFKL